MGGLRIVLPLVIGGGCHFTTPEPVQDGSPPGTDAASDGRADAPLGACPSFYASLPMLPHRYRVVMLGSDWTTQKAACATDAPPRSYLAIPDSPAELVALDNFAANATEYWVGVSRAMDGSYQTVNGTPQTFLPWATNQPVPPPQDCVKALAATGEFATDACSKLSAAVCECDPALP